MVAGRREPKPEVPIAWIEYGSRLTMVSSPQLADWSHLLESADYLAFSTIRLLCLLASSSSYRPIYLAFLSFGISNTKQSGCSQAIYVQSPIAILGISHSGRQMVTPVGLKKVSPCGEALSWTLVGCL